MTRGLGIVRFAIFALGLMPIAPGRAQLNTRIPHPPAVHTPEETERLVRFYARCVVGGSLQTARAFVRAKAGSPESNRLADRLFARESNCLDAADEGSVRLNAPVTLLRGYVARALYLRANPTLLPVRSAAAVAAPVPARAPAADLDGLFACIVATEPAGADALLRSLPGSEDERSAIGTLRPKITPCAPPTAAFAMTKPILRAGIAVALYEWSEPTG